MRIVLLALLICSGVLPAQTNIQIGEPAPEVIITHWLKNEPADPSLEGKFVVLDFWATWCKPCLDVAPHLNELREQFPREDLYFISLTSESPKTARSVFDRVDFQVSVASDVTRQTEINFGNGETGLSRWPTTVLIDNKNIVRWIGSPGDLTAGRMDRFLTQNLVVDPSLETATEDYNGPEWRERSLDEKLPEEAYWNMMEDDSLTRFVYVFPADDLPKRTEGGDTYSLGTIGYFHAATLDEYFSFLHPTMIVEMPAYLRSRKFTIAFKNNRPDRKSSREVIRKIVAQAGYRVAFSTAETLRHSITVVESKKLKPTVSDSSWPTHQEDDFGALLCEKFKLTDLARELIVYTDDLWEYKGNDRKRYDFELFLSSPETIISSLKAYGLRVKSKKTEVEVVTILPRN